MNRINWSFPILVIGLVLLLVLLSSGLFGGWGYRGWGMMRPGMMGHWWGFAPLGWAGMVFMWLIPAGIIVLTLLGIIWLVQSLRQQTSDLHRTCPNCGKGIQADWQHCPYCGTGLK